MSAGRAERAYALLLRAYPAEFRSAYGREMTSTFRDLLREAGTPGIGFWMGIVADVARSAPVLRAESLRARWAANLRPEDGRMKTMGVLAVLIGLAQAVNAAIELNAGGTAGWPGLVVAMAIVTSVLLVIAGVALLAGASSAPTFSKIAAVSWLALVVLVRAVHPWMSIFATLLAVVFPLVLLAYVWMGRGRGMTSAV
jgi:uncharacterized iron-regulated membrane protein